jgi:hypothetical protein
MAPSTQQAYNDGGIPFGSWTLTIYIGQRSIGGAFQTARGTYIVETIPIDRPLKIIRRTDEIGGPNGSVGVADFVTAEATIQLGTSSSLRIINGDYFTATFNATIGAENFFITNVKEPFEMQGYWKQDCSIIKAYSPIAAFSFTPN